jgi:hypothetical protein
VSVLVHRLVALEAPARRPAAEAKDFSPLDERELERIALERERAAVAASGGSQPVVAAAAGSRPPIAASAASSRAPAGRIHPPADGTGQPAAASPLGDGEEHGAGEVDADFRAVAPPVLSFTQGRRR